jgi:putative spermidine/putrescine transport system ATP-binding protein
MAADTRDAPAKGPQKGFSLRSRLLGLPTGEPQSATASITAALQPRDEPQPVEAPAPDDAAPEIVAQPVEDAVETKSYDAPSAHLPPAKIVVPNDDDDEGEENEEPRVGVALPRRTSLLSAAFGFGDRKVKPEAARPVEQIIAPPPTPAPAPEPEPIEEPRADERDILNEPVRHAPIFETVVRTAEPEPHTVVVEPTSFKAPVVEEEVSVAASDLVHAARTAPEPTPVVAAPAEPVPFVQFHGVKKTYDGAQLVVKDLHLEIAKGEFLTLLGPSGSGKTTTLMMLAGFEQPTAGDILFNGQSLTTLPPHKRGLGFVFQNYALFPHMTVAENLAFPLEVRKMGRGEIRERVSKALAMVELSGFDKRKPHQLSGGQQQRVAVARALVFDPELVLMDEPLGALDKHLREQMQYELKRLHRELGVTVVYVTHDQGEALTLSDRIAVFHEGIIQQLDTPKAIYDAPSNAFVAGFIGENNALPGKIVAVNGAECTVELIGGARVKAQNGNCDAVGRAGVVCVRPEYLSVSAETHPGGNHVAALIEDFIFHGDHLRVKLSAPGMNEIIVKAPARGAKFPAKGVAVTLSWDPSAARAFVS